MKRLKRLMAMLLVLSAVLPVIVSANGNIPLGISDMGEEEIKPTYEQTDKNRLYANGRSAVIKEGEDGNTYFYDETGTDIILRDTNGDPIALPENVLVFGGSNTETVASTNIVMQSGTVHTIYGGGNSGAVEGDCSVTVTGGKVTSFLAGGCTKAQVGGNVTVNVSNLGVKLPNLVGGSTNKGVTGDVSITVDNCTVTNLFGGSQGTTGNGIGGNLSVTLNNVKATNIYSGGNSGDVAKNAVYHITGTTTCSGVFTPARSKNPTNLASEPKGSVKGRVNVFLPEGYDYTTVNTAGSTKVHLYVNNVEMGVKSFTVDGDNIYVNGRSILIREKQNSTYIYDALGEEKLHNDAVDNKTIYGGSLNNTADSSTIVVESGKLAALHLGGSNGAVTGNAAAEVHNGANIGTVDISGVNGSVVINLPEGFNLVNLNGTNASARIFVDGVEKADEKAVPATVTHSGTEYFANGIPIVINEDSDGKTYIYNADGTQKLLAEPVEGERITVYGGSEAAGTQVASTNVTMRGGSVYYLYGGGKYGSVLGDSKVSVTGGLVDSAAMGGCYDADVFGDCYVEVQGDTVAKSIGAGRYGRIHGDSHMTVRGSHVKSIYGGLRGERRGVGYPSADVMGNAIIKAYDWSGEAIFGGSNNSGALRGNANLELAGVQATAGIQPLQKMDRTGLATSVKGTAFIAVSDDVDRNLITPANDPRVVISKMTSPAPGELLPVNYQLDQSVFSAEGDSGKLVFRVLELPQQGNSITRTGDAIFITFPNGKNMLVDAGSSAVGPLVAAQLQRLGVSSIDYMVASHYHADHVGGMPAVLNAFEVGKVLRPNMESSAAGYINLIQAMNSHGTDSAFLGRGDTLSIGEVQIEVLGPKVDASGKVVLLGSNDEERYNNSSILLRLTYKGQSALLTGDLYLSGESELLNSYADAPELLKSDFLKVPHHGDTTSSGPAFVKAVAPQVASVSNFLNSDTILNRYLAQGSQTTHTLYDGTTKIIIDGSTVMVKREKLAVAASDVVALNFARAEYKVGSDGGVAVELTLANGYEFNGVSQYRALLGENQTSVETATNADGSVTHKITISNAYLDSLGVGKHTFGIHYSAQGNPGLTFELTVRPGDDASPIIPPNDDDDDVDIIQDDDDEVFINSQSQEQALKTLDKIIAGKQPAANVETQAGSNGKILSIVPISLSGDSVSLGVETMEKLGGVSDSMAFRLDFASGAEITIPGGFGAITEPGRISYPISYSEKPENADDMKKLVGQDKDAQLFSLGGRVTLPHEANIKLPTKLGNGTAYVYLFNPQTGRLEYIAGAAIAGGKLNFSTAEIGQYIILKEKI